MKPYQLPERIHLYTEGMPSGISQSLRYFLEFEINFETKIVTIIILDSANDDNELMRIQLPQSFLENFISALYEGDLLNRD